MILAGQDEFFLKASKAIKWFLPDIVLSDVAHRDKAFLSKNEKMKTFFLKERWQNILIICKFIATNLDKYVI